MTAPHCVKGSMQGHTFLQVCVKEINFRLFLYFLTQKSRHTQKNQFALETIISV